MKKLFHKHVSQRVKRYHRHFTKYLYERDTIFATLWIFVFMVVMGLIPINFYFLNPLKLALKDFDFNDITYAKLGKSANTPIDKRFVIINIGHYDRAQIAFLIEKTATYDPKVMGLDAEFHEANDPEQDSILGSTLEKYSNLVVVNRIDYNDKQNFEKSGYFKDKKIKRGYANLVGESPEERMSIRYYSSYEKEKKVRYTSFGAMLIKEYDPKIYERLMARKKKQETLNYSRHTNQYPKLTAEQVMTNDFDSSLIRGKIALLAYVNEDPNDIEDKFYTPMNPKFAGKSTPDMNGIVIHANYISMVLDEDYIKTLPSWVNWLVAVLIGWLHMSFFIRYYLESHIWFHLVAKIAQLLSAIFFVYLGMLVYDRYNIKLDMKYTLVTIVLAVDIIYFYEAFAVWMHKKFHYHTVFHQKHH